MITAARPATADTNVVIHALIRAGKEEAASAVLEICDFLSIQVLNEYANVAKRRLNRSWRQIEEDLENIRGSVPQVLPIDTDVHLDGLRIASRYRLSFYDALILAVALSGGARILYSEDMQHGMTIDETLRVVNPFTRGIIED